ncbi:alpha/beta hydrolase fold domain-containing protein [Sphingobacterium puteale]|uniref:alpha/beta hydrolase fold domain-containing protein n=1 Tax=Sphingobacterium puteale TaxID=2420510 RepID=UPI003D95F23B
MKWKNKRFHYLRLSYIFILLFYGGTVWAQHKAIPRDTTYNTMRVWRQIKKNYPQARPAVDSTGAELRVIRNVVYTHLPHTDFGSRDLHLDIIRPSDKLTRAAVLWIHGGGWRSGHKEMDMPIAQLLARKGYVCIPVEHQLSLEAKYPQAILNIKSAIIWVKEHAGRYGIDSSRIVVAGSSAGGQLASLVGLTGGVGRFDPQVESKASTHVQAIVNMDGVVDFLAPLSLNMERKADSPDAFWLGGTFAEKPLVWKEASPIFWAREDQPVPMLFINSGFPRFHAGQDELVGMLKRWGTPHEVHCIDVEVHPFWLFHPWVNHCVDMIDQFLKHLQLKEDNA